MLETFETVAKAVADSSKVRILKLLESGELCVCQIITVLDLAPATVSKHLTVLKAAGLVQQRRDGKWVYYRRADREINAYSRHFLAFVGELLNDDPTVEEDRHVLKLVNAVPLQVICHQGRAALGPNVQSSKDTTDCEGQACR